MWKGMLYLACLDIKCGHYATCTVCLKCTNRVIEVKIMKEIYVAPEANLVCFEANEKLANIIDFDKLLNLSGGKGDAVTPSDGDINIVA